MKTMQNYKIDFFEKAIPGDMSDHQINYRGFMSFRLPLSPEDLTDKIHHSGGKVAYEGVEIYSIRYDEYTLIEVTNFTDSSDIFIDVVKNIILGKSKSAILPDKKILLDDSDITYLKVDKDDYAKFLTFSENNKIDIYSILKQEHIYEWGATGLFSSYLIGIASALTVKLFEELPNLRSSSFDMTNELKKYLIENQDINPNALALKRMVQSNGLFIYEFRTYHERIFIKTKDGEIIDVEVQRLRNSI